MKFINYLMWSNIKISLDLSPCAWGFKWISDRDNPEIKYMFYCRFLPLSFLVILDDGAFLDEQLGL